MDDLAMLEELRPTAERLIERHLGMTKEWFPHELVTWRPLPSEGDTQASSLARR